MSLALASLWALLEKLTGSSQVKLGAQCSKLSVDWFLFAKSGLPRQCVASRLALLSQLTGSFLSRLRNTFRELLVNWLLYCTTKTGIVGYLCCPSCFQTPIDPLTTFWGIKNLFNPVSKPSRD